MAFWGHSFTFNDIPCEDFELMIYDIDGTSQSTGKFSSGVTVIEDKVSAHWKPYFYGVKLDNKLKFTMVFGVNQKRVDENKFLDRYELEAIAAWLTGHNKYMWLEIQQEDLAYVRYKCIVTGLEMVEFGMLPWALRATIECDSPYAYLYPQTFEYTVNGEQTISFYNESSHNGYYMPVLILEAIQNIRISDEMTVFEVSTGDTVTYANKASLY